MTNQTCSISSTIQLLHQFLCVATDKEHFTDNWVQKQCRRYEKGTGGLYAIELKNTGELIGQCGLLLQFVDCIPKWEVGYHFFRQFWGNGYATEAAQACRDFCFKNEMAETLISLIHPKNENPKLWPNELAWHFESDSL